MLGLGSDEQCCQRICNLKTFLLWVLWTIVSQKLRCESFPLSCIDLFVFFKKHLTWISVFGQVSRLAAVLSKSLSLLYAWSWRVFLLRRASGNDAEGVHCPLRVVVIDGLPQLDFDVNHRWLSSQNPSHQNRSSMFPRCCASRDIVINVSDIRTFSKQVCTCPQFRFDRITCVLQHRSTRVLHVTSLHASRCTSKTVSASLCEAGSTSLIRGRSSFTTHISLFLSPTIRRLMLVEGSIQGLEKWEQHN